MVLAVVLMGAFSACNNDSPTSGNGTPNLGSLGEPLNVSNPEVRLAPSGLEWTRRESGTLSGLISVTSGNGKIVVVGNNGVILTSTDGVSWTLHQAGANVAMNHVIWTGEQFIAVGDSGTIVTSRDGEQWILRSQSKDYHLESIAWNGKTLVAVGGKFIHSGLSQPTMVTSLDGVTWSASSPGDGIFYGAAWGGVAYLAVGFRYNFTTVSDNSHPVMYLSRDGKDWDVINANIREYNAFLHVIYDGRRFVAVGGSRNVNDSFATAYMTSDFKQWDPGSVSTRKTLHGVAYTGSEYIAVGQGGAIVMADTSGSIWRLRASGVKANLNAVAATSLGWQLIVVGDSGTILTTPCGKSSDAPPTSHPLVGNWKQVKDFIRHADGSQTTSPMDSLGEFLFDFKADRSLTLFVFDGSALLTSLSGSWSAVGSQLYMSFPGGSSEPTHYILSGNEATITFPDTIAAENVTRTWVLQRL